jgi:hypothetical protein
MKLKKFETTKDRLVCASRSSKSYRSSFPESSKNGNGPGLKTAGTW